MSSKEQHSKSSLEIVIGLAVLAVAVIFLYALIKNSSVTDTFFSQNKQLIAEFSSLDGISVGSDVRLAGVKIGFVSDINLDMRNYSALATLSVREDLQIPSDSEAIIASESLLGQKYISVNVGGSDRMLLEGETFMYSQGSIDLINLLLKFSNNKSN